MKEYTLASSSSGISGGKSFDVGSEGRISFFATASFNNDFSSKSNGTAKASVKVTELLTKTLTTILS
jgi:hypothetical protein